MMIMMIHKHPMRSAGFSLVELMIAMTLGLILLAGVVSIVVNTSASFNELNKASRQLDNGRYAIQVLREDIRHAGYYGEFYALAQPGVAPDPCDTSQAGLLNGMRLPVQGYTDGAGLAAGCAPGRVAGSDVLVVRRAATVATPTAAMVAADFYLQARTETLVLDNGPYDMLRFNLTNRDGSVADIRRYLVHIYYIRDCSVCSGGGDGIPTLVRRELQGGNFNTITAIAEGIETLRIAYGFDNNGDGTVNTLSSDSTSLSLNNWFDLMTLEVGVLARSVDPSPGHTDLKSYTLAGVTLTPGGNFKRHAYTSLARLVNPGDRRIQ
jgi:type IV pilus assembly protein PilW